MKLEGFEFLNELELSPCGHYRAAEILGEIPLPKLEVNDRMILPIGEGMVFTIKDDYTFLGDPEADERFEKIVCRFCGKTATVSMLNFERNGKLCQKIVCFLHLKSILTNLEIYLLNLLQQLAN